MPLEDLRDDELDALEKGGLEALGDDALARLEGAPQVAEPSPSIPQAPAATVPRVAQPGSPAPPEAAAEALSEFPRRIFGGLREASERAARPIAEPIERGIKAADELIAPLADNPLIAPAIGIGTAALRRGADGMGIGRFEKDALAGVAGTVSGGAGVARAFGFEKAGELISRVAEESAKSLRPPDPNFADEVAAGFGSMATFMVPGYGVQAGAAKLAAFAPRVAGLLGLSSSAVLEAAVEGGDAYNSAFRKTGDGAEAQRAGNMAFWANLPLVYFTNKMYFPDLGRFGLQGGQWGVHKAVEGALTEGGQEASQAIIGNLAVHDPVMRGVLESFGVGAVTGGAMGGAISLAEREAGKPAESPAPERKEMPSIGQEGAQAAQGEIPPRPVAEDAELARLLATPPVTPAVLEADLVPPLSVEPFEAPPSAPPTVSPIPPGEAGPAGQASPSPSAPSLPASPETPASSVGGPASLLSVTGGPGEVKVPAGVPADLEGILAEEAGIAKVDPADTEAMEGLRDSLLEREESIAAEIDATRAAGQKISPFIEASYARAVYRISKLRRKGAGDTSFDPARMGEEPTPEQIAAAAPTGESAAPHEMSPGQLAVTFPGASPEDLGRLVGRAALSGQSINPELANLPGVREALERQEASLREAEQKELLRGTTPTPLRDLVLAKGISPAAAREYGGEFGKDNLRGYVRKGGTTPDMLREAAVEAGILPEDADLSAFFERWHAEMRLGPKRWIKPGQGYNLSPGAEFGVAEPAPGQPKKPASPKVRRLPPEMPPEEAAAALEKARIAVGDTVPTIRPVDDPVYGKIKTGTPVEVLAVSLARAEVLVQHGGEDIELGRPVAVVPVTALAAPVKGAHARGIVGLPVESKPPTPSQVKASAAEATGVKKPERIIAIGEAKALRAQLLAESKAARDAAIAAREEMRQGIIKDLRDRIAAEAFESKMLRNEWATDVKYGQHLRNRIVAYAKLMLPAEHRGDLLTRAARADSPGDMAKAFRDIDEKSAELFNKSLMSDIRIMVERAMSSKTFPVSVKQRIRALLEGIRVENWSEKTIERMQAEQEFVDHLRAAGEDVTVPQWLIEQLAKLSYRPLKSIPTAELLRLYQDLRFLIQQGKDIRAAIRALEEMEREETLAAVIEGATDKTVQEFASTKQGVNRPFGGPALTWAQRQKNRWLKLVDTFQEVGIYITPIQAVVDDGGTAERELLWEPLQAGYIPRVRFISKGTENIGKLIAKTGRVPNEQEADRILTVIYKEQDLRPHLHKMGMTDEKIDSIKLTALEQEWADGLREPFARGWVKDRLTYLSAKLFNKEFIPEERYFPLMTKRGVVPSQMQAEEVLAFEMDLRRKNVDRGRIMERVEGAAREFRTDLLGIYLDGIRQQANLLYMAEPILKAHGVVRDERYGLAKGDARQEFWKDYLDTLARDGRFQRSRSEWVLDFLRKNIAIGGLSFKPHVVAVQFSSMANGAVITGGGHLREALSAGPEWDSFVEKNMPLVHERHGGEPAVQEALEGSLLPGLKTAGMRHIAKADHWTAKKVALAAYFQYLDRHNLPRDISNPVPAALAYAQAVPGRTMASPWLIDMPLALSRGGPLARAILQFQSESLAKFALLTHQVFGGKEGKAAAAEDLTWLMAATLYEAGVRRAWRWAIYAMLLAIGAVSKKQYDKAMAHDDSYFRQVAMASLNTLPGVGAVGNYIAYDSSPIPVVDTVGDLFKGSANLVTGAAADRPLKAMRGLTQALTAASMMAGIPGAGMAGWIARQPLRGLQDKKAKKGGSRL